MVTEFTFCEALGSGKLTENSLTTITVLFVIKGQKGKSYLFICIVLYYELLTSKALISSETHHKHIILKHYAKNNPLSLKLYFDIQLVLCICVYVRETQRY